MTEYKLLTDSDPSRLNNLVNLYLQQGWSLYGPPSTAAASQSHTSTEHQSTGIYLISNSSYSMCFYTQAVFKK